LFKFNLLYFRPYKKYKAKRKNEKAHVRNYLLEYYLLVCYYTIARVNICYVKRQLQSKQRQSIEFESMQ